MTRSDQSRISSAMRWLRFWQYLWAGTIFAVLVIGWAIWETRPS